DLGERDAADLEVDRQHLLDDAERQPLGEVQERDPGELAPRRHEAADSSCSGGDSQIVRVIGRFPTSVVLTLVGKPTDYGSTIDLPALCRATFIHGYLGPDELVGALVTAGHAAAAGSQFLEIGGAAVRAP